MSTTTEREFKHTLTDDGDYYCPLTGETIHWTFWAPERSRFLDNACVLCHEDDRSIEERAEAAMRRQYETNKGDYRKLANWVGDTDRGPMMAIAAASPERFQRQ